MDRKQEPKSKTQQPAKKSSISDKLTRYGSYDKLQG